MEGIFRGLLWTLRTLIWTLWLMMMGLAEARGQEIFDFYNGVRGLGMGGARVATVNDETAMLVNPAGLGRLRDYFITVADPEIEVGTKTQAIFGSDITAFLDPQKVLDAINDGNFQGQRFHQRIQVFPSLVFTNFGMGLYGKYSTDAYVDEDSTAFELNYRNDFAAVFGFNFRLWDGRIKLGFNAKAINRAEISRTDLSPAATNLSLSGLASEGFGIGSDVGLLLTAPWQWLPTLGAVYRDVGTTRYDAANGIFLDTDTRPAPTPATLDAGFSLSPKLGKRSFLVISGEYRDVLTTERSSGLDEDPSRKMHYGMELNFSDSFFLRGGMHQNQWTAGLEISMMNYQVQFATYGEDIGTEADPEVERRYVGKFSFRF